MAPRECPICGKTVRLENIERHYENVHPGKAVPPALLKAQKETVRETRRAAPRAVRAGRPPTVAIAVIAIVAVGVLGGAAYLTLAPNAAATNVVTYCGGEGTAQHYHTLLVINSNGVQQEVPGDIGITDSAGYTNPSYPCTPPELHALHTHDGSGVIHAELPASITSTPTLGDFFSIWGEPLLSTQVWTFSGHVRATMYSTASGASTDYSSNPKSIPLQAPPGGADPFILPQYLMKYGAGESSGKFSGEIVWLNVTA